MQKNKIVMFLSSHKKKFARYTILLLLLGLIAIYYHYFFWMQIPPCGTHIWRQTDSAAFAWCYWQNGLDFFHPQIMNRSFGNGYALSEFPVLQYLVAILYSIFGQHWFLLKVVYVLVFIGGLFALFYIVSFFVQEIFWSYFITILFFAAPSLVFYGNTSIPDVAAFSFCNIGIALLLANSKKSHTFYFNNAFLFFALSALLKITYILPFIAIVAISLFFYITKDEKTKQYLQKKHSIATAFLLLIIFSWILILKYYNQQNNNIYFLTGINPYWSNKETAEVKSYIFHRFTTEWATRFFHISIHYIMLFCLVINLVFWKKSNKYLRLLMITIFIGLTSYFFLWYIQFYVHDYYTIPFYSFYIIILLNFLVLIQNIHLPKSIKYILKFLAIILLLFNIKHTKQDFQIRYDEFKMYPKDVVLSDKGLHVFVRKIGIKTSDYIIAIPDGSPQISLALIGNPGFTEFCEGKYDMEKITEKKKQGAKYLIISDTTGYQSLIGELGEPYKKYNSILFYRL